MRPPFGNKRNVCGLLSSVAEMSDEINITINPSVLQEKYGSVPGFFLSTFTSCRIGDLSILSFLRTQYLVSDKRLEHIM